MLRARAGFTICKQTGGCLYCPIPRSLVRFSRPPRVTRKIPLILTRLDLEFAPRSNLVRQHFSSFQEAALSCAAGVKVKKILTPLGGPARPMKRVNRTPPSPGLILTRLDLELAMRSNLVRIICTLTANLRRAKAATKCRLLNHPHTIFVRIFLLILIALYGQTSWQHRHLTHFL